MEDRLALMFNIDGDFSSCMLAGRKVYTARVSDAGDGLYTANTPPGTKTADTIPGYVVNAEATGSIADVKAEAVHDAGTSGPLRGVPTNRGTGWTVTLTRKLDTGHDDDVVFEKGKACESAIACFDRSADMHHSTAGFVLVIK